MIKHILIPTDGSKLSARAAAAGVELAKALGARITVLFAAPAPTPLVYEKLIPVGYMPPDEHEAMIERAAERYLGAVAKQAEAAGGARAGATLYSRRHRARGPVAQPVRAEDS